MARHSSTLAGKIHGWRSLVGCSPWDRKESDTTEAMQQQQQQQDRILSVLVFNVALTFPPLN